VSDDYAVDPLLGSLGDVVEVVRTARDRGMRAIIDLAVNHTSVKHPWLLSARSGRASPFRDFCVRRDKPPAHPEAVSFPGEETSTWQYDEKAGQYYLHSFYKEQPDLNLVSPKAARSGLTAQVRATAHHPLSGIRCGRPDDRRA
jgi:glycosidase